MRYKVDSIDAYMKAIPKDRVRPINQLREAIKNNLPEGFEEVLQYEMISYIIPLSRYPKGYHVTPNTPLPFISLASQKATINLYHNGIYASQSLLTWFNETYKEMFGKKPNMGKSCIRFKEVNELTIDLIAQLCTKMTPQDLIDLYENR